MEWWIVLVSIIGAVGGVLGVISFFRTVRRQHPRFSVRTDSPFLVYGQDEKAEFLVFAATVSNLSDVANSVVEYSLIIGHPYISSKAPIHYSETELGESILETADMSKRLAVKKVRFNWLETPVNIPAHNSVSGYIGFALPSIPKAIVPEVEYALVVMPSEGHSYLEPLILDKYDWQIARHASSEHRASDSNS